MTFQSGGRDIRLTAYEPKTPGPHAAMLLLHGAGGGMDFWLDRIAPLLAGAGLALYGVHYFDRTGTTYAGPALLADGVHVPQWLDTVRDALHWIVARPAVDASRIALVGVSLGGFLAVALGTEPALKVRALVEVSGGLAPDYEAGMSSAFPPTLLLHGDRDTVVPVSFAHALDATLTRLNVPHTFEILPGETHWFSPTAQTHILASTAKFLSQHLR